MLALREAHHESLNVSAILRSNISKLSAIAVCDASPWHSNQERHRL